MKHPPQFVEKLQNMGIPEGAPVRLECRVVGMPPPAIFWKKDNDSVPRTKDRFRSVENLLTKKSCLFIYLLSTQYSPELKINFEIFESSDELSIVRLFQHATRCHRICVPPHPANKKR